MRNKADIQREGRKERGNGWINILVFKVSVISQTIGLQPSLLLTV